MFICWMRSAFIIYIVLAQNATCVKMSERALQTLYRYVQDASKSTISKTPSLDLVKHVKFCIILRTYF